MVCDFTLCILNADSFVPVDGVFQFVFAKQPMNRETKEKTVDRVKHQSVAGVCVCILTGIGAAAAMITQHYTKTGDMLFLAADVLLCILMLYGIKVGKCLRVEEKANPAAEEWKNK